MLYLLDTNAFSDLMAEDPKIHGHASSLGPADRIGICPVVRGEVLYGIKRLPEGRRHDELQRKATRLFETVQCDPVPVAAADHYADLKVSRERAGLVLDENDLWIAATALALEATLVTRDSDLQRIRGLNVENWNA